MKTLPRLALTLGDHQGIGPEIIVKALKDPAVHARCLPVVVGARELVRQQVERFAPHLRLCELPSPSAWGEETFAGSKDCLWLWDPRLEATSDEVQLPEQTYIRVAVEGCQRGHFDALVTAPISKESMYARGFRFPGHTEYLGHLTGVPRSVMGFSAPKLRVSLVTVHEPLERVPSLITAERVLETVRISWQALRQLFGVEYPRLAVCGLNPHAGERGHLGREELERLVPALERARAEGIEVEGPFPADTVFVQAVKGRFDMVVALYHDQGLIPVKLLSFGESVNVTLGLPIIRTSVDHGVAYDIAGRGVADASSMTAALELALELVRTRNNHTRSTTTPQTTGVQG